MSTTASPSAPVDYSRKWFVMIAVMAGILLATIDGSIVNIAFPTLVESLDTTFNVVQWVSLAYLLTTATLTLGMSRLGDVFGKRRLFISGFAIFTIASGLCGLAPSVHWLIGFRVLQGVGSVLILALGTALVVEAFPASERGKALGWISGAVSVGIVSGPVIGGMIISNFGWRPIFLVNIPIGIIGTWLAVRFVPRASPLPGQSFDLLGTALLSVSLFSLCLAMTMGQGLGFTAPPILIGFAVSAVSAAAFIYVQLNSESPMLQLRLFRNPMLSVGVVSAFLAFVCLSASFLLMPFYLQGVLGLPIGTVGLLLGIGPLTMGILSPVVGSLSDRVGVRRLTVVGLAVLVGAYSILLTFDTTTTTTRYALFAVTLGLGLGLFQSPNNSAIMGSVPREYMGIGGGILTITRILGVTTGVAVLGSVWAAGVAAASGGSLPEGGASAGSPAAQVAGMHTAFTVAVFIMAAALIVGLLGFWEERKTRLADVAVSEA